MKVKVIIILLTVSLLALGCIDKYTTSGVYEEVEGTWEYRLPGVDNNMIILTFNDDGTGYLIGSGLAATQSSFDYRIENGTIFYFNVKPCFDESSGCNSSSKYQRKGEILIINDFPYRKSN